MKKEQAGREAAKRRNDVIRRTPIFEEEESAFSLFLKAAGKITFAAIGVCGCALVIIMILMEWLSK